MERKYKALQYKVKYLELELEDVEEVFEKCKQQFQNDFGNLLDKHNIQEENNMDSDVNRELKDEPKVDSKTLNRLFKNISLKTHPDKFVNNKKKMKIAEEKFKRANEAKENGRLSELIEIAADVGAKIPKLSEDYLFIMERECKVLLTKVKVIKQSSAWLWYHCDKKSKPTLKKRICKSLGIQL